MYSFRSRIDPLLAMLTGWPRRALAGLCLLGALASALTGGHRTRPQPADFAVLVVAARALSPGVQLAAQDLRLASWPEADLPVSAITRTSQAIGHRVGAPMTRGEPVTTVRLLESGVAASLGPGQVATTITLADPGEAAILQPGALIDLYPASTDQVLAEGRQVTDSSAGQRAVSGVQVLAVVGKPADTGQPAAPMVIVGADRRAMSQLAAHVSSTFLATLVKPP
jgi:Flp pilus assembly protein CpaB